MTTNSQVYRRLMRRQTHASRSKAGVVAAVLGIVLAAGIGTAIAAWALFPGTRDAISSWVSPSDDTRATIMLASGIAAVVIGVVFVMIALTPGSKARRARDAGRSAIVLDDAAMADAIADDVARENALDRSQVSVYLSKKHAKVAVTPTSGVAVAEENVRSTAARTLSKAGFPAEVRVSVSEKGSIA